LTLFFQAQPLALTGWSVVDAQGNETQIKLSGRVEGATDFPDSLFTFVDPDFAAPQENR
jgi:outer membrane lipoprotein-sorting protein